VVSYTTVSPLPLDKSSGGLFSVALSRGSPRVGVTHHLALWSPDFPRYPNAEAHTYRDHPIDSSTNSLGVGPQRNLMNPQTPFVLGLPGANRSR